jgi:hypothetical protein
VGDISREALDRLARARNPRLRGRAVKLQRYPMDPLIEGVHALRDVYRQMADAGCIMLVDELSLFHPGIRSAVAACPMIGARNSAVVTVSPFVSELEAQQQLLREEIRGQLASVFDRFELDYDPQCELGVNDEWRLRRWLHQSLPETLQVLRSPRVERAQVELFAQELRADTGAVAAGPPGIL